MADLPDLVFLKPRLSNLWVTGVNQIHPLLSFLAVKPDASADVREVDRHLRQTASGAGTVQGIQDLAHFAEYAGLVTRTPDRHALTLEGRRYAGLFPESFNARHMPGIQAAQILREIWVRRPGANRLFQSMQSLLAVLIQLGAHSKAVGAPGPHVNASQDVLVWTLNYLQAYGVIERTGEGTYRLMPAGITLAAKLGMIEVRDDDTTNGPDLSENVATERDSAQNEVAVQSGVPEPQPATEDGQEREQPVELEDRTEPVDPTEPEDSTQPEEQSLADTIRSLLSEKLKPMVQAHLELKAQVMRVEEEIGRLEPVEAALQRVSNVASDLDAKIGELHEQLARIQQQGSGDNIGALLEQMIHRPAVAAVQEAATPPLQPPLALVQSRASCRTIPSERALVEDMTYRLNAAGYKVTLSEVANLYTCVKAGRLTILAGPPGVGKSSTVRQFADAMGHKSTLEKVSVRRGWTEDQQFMGSINRLHQRYEPAPTGVVPHLLAAGQDSDVGLYWFLLDEFNLSTPEYYFAEFISILEDPQPKVSLYTAGVTVMNTDRYPASIAIGDNVHFFGTVNLDDTASPLSPRLIDRANLIWMERQVTTDMLRSAELKPGTIGPVSAAELRSKYRRQPEFVGTTRTWWDHVQQILSIRSDDLGAPHFISSRCMVGLARYVANAPQGALDQKDAFDFGLAQRILPGIRGFSSGYSKRLQRLHEFTAGQKFTQSTALLERILRNGTSRGHEYDFFSCLW